MVNLQDFINKEKKLFSEFEKKIKEDYNLYPDYNIIKPKILSILNELIDLKSPINDLIVILDKIYDRYYKFLEKLYDKPEYGVEFNKLQNQFDKAHIIINNIIEHAKFINKFRSLNAILTIFSQYDNDAKNFQQRISEIILIDQDNISKIPVDREVTFEAFKNKYKALVNSIEDSIKNWKIIYRDVVQEGLIEEGIEVTPKIEELPEKYQELLNKLDYSDIKIDPINEKIVELKNQMVRDSKNREFISEANFWIENKNNFKFLKQGLKTAVENLSHLSYEAIPDECAVMFVENMQNEELKLKIDYESKFILIGK